MNKYLPLTLSLLAVSIPAIANASSIDMTDFVIGTNIDMNEQFFLTSVRVKF